jgi:hypothetical protein
VLTRVLGNELADVSNSVDAVVEVADFLGTILRDRRVALVTDAPERGDDRDDID